MQITTFKLDVTPPIGAQMAYAINQGVDSPIFIRGLLLDDGRMRSAIVSCDFIYIWGQAWLDWRQQIAEAAKTQPDHVFLHCVHQHDSMRIAHHEASEATGLLNIDTEYCEWAIKQLIPIVRKTAEGKWRQVARLLTSERRLSGLASNRRLLDKNGKVFATRFSMCKDPALHALPTGIIDPFLRTIAFADEDRTIAAMHLYASHPMAAYGRGLVSADVPGRALEHAGDAVFQLYLTGCAGNISFGKYFLGDKEKSLQSLGTRLGKGFRGNLAHLEEKPLGPLQFHKISFPFPLDLEDDEGTHILKTAKAIISEEPEKWRECSIYRLSIGSMVHLLSFPSEVCVEYQLFAQSLLPEHFVACAAYANGMYHYIPTARMFEEGGYEPSASLATPEIEERLKNAIAELLHEPRTKPLC